MKTPKLIISSHPRYPFEVTAPASLFGRRLRRFFRTKSAAQVYLTDLQARVTRNAVSPVTREEQMLLSRWRPSLSLADMEAALVAAAERKTLSSRPVSDILTDYLADLSVRRCRLEVSPLHERDAKRHVRFFLSSPLAVVPLAEVTAPAIAGALATPAAPRTQLNRLLFLRAVFSWCCRRGLLRVNPATTVPRPAARRPRPGILTPRTMSEVLRVAQALPDARPLRWLVFGGFAGLRSSEVLRLRWEDIRWEEGQLYVAPGKTPNAERWVSLTPPVLAFRSALRPEATGLIIPRDFRRCKRRLPVLPKNALRHSYGSHHLVHYGDPAKTALEMGHHTPAVTFNFYRRAVTKADAAAWWALAPETGAMVGAETGAAGLTLAGVAVGAGQ